MNPLEEEEATEESPPEHPDPKRRVPPIETGVLPDDVEHAAEV